MKMKRHVCVNIDAILKFTDEKLGDIFEGDGTEIRDELLERKANGERLIGADGCEGFDPVTGCPGHKISN